MTDQPTKLKFVNQVMVVTGIFCTMTALLLVLNFWQIKQTDPLESVALKTLVAKLNTEPNNDELKQEIRNLDLLARKAYFNSHWQVKTGSYLLFFGAIVFFISLKISHDLQSKIEKPIDLGKNDPIARLLSQRWIIITISILFLGALGASYLSNDYLKMYGIGEEKAKGKEVSTIKQIDVSPVAANDSTGNGSLKSGKDSALNGKAKALLTIADIKNQSNSFRGPFGNGSSWHKHIPTDWDGAKGRKVLWKVKVPKQGFNSPVIWDDKIFLAGADAKSRVVYCFDLATGKTLWQQAATNINGSPGNTPKVTNDTGLSASTVAVDGQRVFAIFANGDLIAFDMEGKRLWAKALGLPDNHYGHSSSLIVLKNKLFIQFDTNKGGRLIALNVLTGATIWDTKRASKIAWSSPVLMPSNNGTLLITTSNPYVAAYNTETGKEVWSVECLSGEVAPSATYGGGLVFAAQENAKLVAIQPGSPAKILWEGDEYLPEVSSPVVSNNLLFICTSFGVMACYDAKTGKKNWENEFGTGFYSSPVVVEGKLYAIDMKGKMHIVKVSKEKKIISEPTLGEKAYATPAFADGKIILRGSQYLYCIGDKK
jgi:outer membrane protein assembly factor BamB